ncbi:hypothetical protein ANCDUO_03489 [Ancylostoma duodenale]|uniref:7TM GPCR serpentine receptor class x (Srx) domain-containing protein n=1 Tax=Ancylostoma duodenale TaxID=51022 RepID=A0A0C2H3Q7_9BILA|nr:hypothetical protein ANCDUO_03489 [Ancylostoma duodenale]
MTGNSTVMNGDLTSLYGGIVGGALNIHNIVAMCHIKDFSTSYGDLCKARAVFNIVNLSVFVFYVAPVTIFKYLPRGDEVGRILALIAAACYCAIPILQVAVAYNRIVAIFVPVKYNKWCTRKWAKKIDYATNTSEKRRNVKLFWQVESKVLG